MGRKGLLFMLIVIMGLSLGPLTYFYGGTQEQIGVDEPPEEGERQFYVSESNFTGTVNRVDPYVFFLGSKYDNSREQAEQELNEVLPEVENYSISINLAEGEHGLWRYTIAIPVNSTAVASEYGFKMSFLLSNHYQNTVTYRKARVKMPSQVSAKTIEEGKSIQVVTDNRTIDANVIYSQGMGRVEITCPRIISSTAGRLTEVLARCAQKEDTFFKYGVTQTHFSRAGETGRLNQTLNVQNIIYYEAEYDYSQVANFSTGELEDLSAEIRVDRTKKSLEVKAMEEKDFNQTEEYLIERGLEKVKETTLLLEVDIPEVVVIDSIEYEIVPRELDTAEVRVPRDDYKDSMEFEVVYRILYGKIFALRVNYLG